VTAHEARRRTAGLRRRLHARGIMVHSVGRAEMRRLIQTLASLGVAPGVAPPAGTRGMATAWRGHTLRANTAGRCGGRYAMRSGGPLEGRLGNV